ncbi:recombinase [Epilithonimonas arachidiradicis]|uniref:Recombinase n=1 Tax=Epilithonimonas arachidiradicis TaxID=1617282 RepID=A0A420CN26_9FLAO|nr:recombinase [Epilithonimonas arachidiradicis]RKE79810.1 site-specific recombinase [Epilithonimonas arachidiradicis]GGG51589.1 recombinase [Epilithonimonas arachidiradicis]
MAIRLFRKDSFSTILKHYFSERNETLSLQPLSEIITSLKKEDLDVFTAYLKDNELITENLIYYIFNVFKDRPFNLSLTEADILSENAFYPEFKKRILNKVLPPIENEQTIWYLVDNVLVTPKKDLQFFQNSPEDKVDELFQLLKIDRFIDHPHVKKELLFSINILAWRVIGNALDVEVMKMVPEYRNFDNPFLALQNEFDILNAKYKDNPGFHLSSTDEIYKQTKIYLDQCQEFVNIAFKNSSKYGISSKTNQALLKIRQQLQRMSDIIKLFVIDEDKDYLINSKQLFFNILRYKSHKNNLRDLVSDSTRLMSHLITNHTAETGTHYITSTFKAYMKMFWKASGGGVIVGALCVLKMLYSYIPASDFAHAFLFSMNYAMGFVMIYLMHFTLATKQPAMTAATMAKVLSEGDNRKTYMEFAHVVSQLFRSQFIAFVGNVLLSFPVSLMIIYGLEILFKQNFAFEKSARLIHDLNPFDSKAILHACIAGVFLFISGVISGNISNNSVFYQIPRRIAKNPLINYFFGQNVAKRLSVYYSKNWAGIISNFWFGVFLGATAPIGLFLGLDLDIRHITFAAGNFALGLYGKDFVVSSYTFWVSFVTVFVIGFFNFAVSFGLSMLLAFRSRKVELSEAREIFKEIFRYFIKNPFRFFFPLRSMLDEKSKKMIQEISTKSADH